MCLQSCWVHGSSYSSSFCTTAIDEYGFVLSLIITWYLVSFDILFIFIFCFLPISVRPDVGWLLLGISMLVWSCVLHGGNPYGSWNTWSCFWMIFNKSCGTFRHLLTSIDNNWPTTPSQPLLTLLFGPSLPLVEKRFSISSPRMFCNLAFQVYLIQVYWKMLHIYQALNSQHTYAPVYSIACMFVECV